MRFDERDIMFARMAYKPGTSQYEDYYKINPDKKDYDEELRNMPHVCGMGTATYDPINSPMVDATFEFLSNLHPLCEGSPNKEKIVDYDLNLMTNRIKGLASFYRANLVGIVKMKEDYYYSHRGRNLDHYGEENNDIAPYGIVFAVEMSKETIQRAPQLSVSLGSTKGYVDAAIVGMILSYYIRSLGYEARNHMDGNYLVIPPLMARDAGLGQLGRNGLLVTKEYGPRVRLGVVTTNMPLNVDEPEDFGLTELCTECGICAKTCPGKSISKDDPIDYGGQLGFKINHEECYKRWRSIGTDCGICLANCPLSDVVDQDVISKMKNSKEIRQKIIDDYKEKYPIRPYIKGNMDWM